MKDKFLWKEGDLMLEKENIPVTQEQTKRAKKAIDETIKDFKKRLKETKK